MADHRSQLAAWVRQACLIEVRSEKPGNVSPSHAFGDASVGDFEQSAGVIAPILAAAAEHGFGASVLKAVQSTQDAVGHNTNLGIVLLLTPLVCVPPEQTLRDGIGDVLDGLSVADAVAVYAAIEIASPGGLGTAETQDVSTTPTVNLRECMRLAQHRDLIAAQYVNNFADVFGAVSGWLCDTRAWTIKRHQRLAWVSLNLMARFGDSLIRRKCGPEIERQVKQQSTTVLQSGWPFTESSQQLFQNFDRFLRADGHRRNPGTTADMIAAIVFAALREGLCTTDDAESQLIFPEDSHD